MKTLPKILTERSFAKRIYSYWQFWLVVLLLSIGTWQASVHIEEWGDGARERVLEAWEDAWVAEREAKSLAIKVAYELDTYGGATPQETWQMFIEALEAGDTDLAARYFIVEYQDKWKTNFNLGKESGALESFLKDDVPLIVSEGYYKDSSDKFEYATSDIQGGPGMTFTLVLNRQANIWKIYDL